ncbi:MAG TPA: NHLP bacteriocin export ABC transporter permease/ATPase subunit [Candidatus Eisenbergiella merdavium]|uniref:NHLP bacteriocin export ABC transporter permease/ATPase subunit n=1 Tax=Candidatus Eisenbergiella merdavium TaxID=2838551 RepID=A0A9D2NE98_9FIRM|nr:NHLP bacteriocin export ABC transporter permease/ATPase subunit [Candidatus Eisenbergiella merdavium]
MGWFDEQIRQRKQNDDDIFAESFVNIADAVMGARGSSAFRDQRKLTKDAIDEILRYFHVKSQEIPDEIKDLNEQLEFLMRPCGIMRRTVRLEKGWYREAAGAMLGVRKDDGSVAAFIPSGISGYSFFDKASGKRRRLNRKNEELFEEDAIAFYKPFPLKKLGIGELLLHILQTLSPADYILFGLAALAVTLVGMLTPRLNNIIFSDIITNGNLRVLLAMTAFLVCVSFSTTLLTSVKEMLLARIETKLDVSVEAATMMRILSLPADFFKQYSSGDLASRSQYINMLCNQLISVMLSAGLTSAFSLVYISQIFSYAPALAVPALLVILSLLVFSLVVVFMQMRVMKRNMEAGVAENGLSYALIAGVQKIRLAGAEKRAFARWGNQYAKAAALSYNPPLLLKISSVVTTAISLAGTIVIYYFAVRTGASVADYYAFNTAYGMVSGAFVSLSSVAMLIAQIRPILDMARPIMEAVPEISEGKQVITRLSGGIELNNVSFRYSEHMPPVIDDLSLKIRPGQYVAIVGATGCGKSTLLRLMLGFETPQKGAVYYDGRDLASIDPKSLRRRIGVVMQNGKLFQGDIYSNIVISAPWLTLDDAWAAAELAGIAEDIRRMSMGMHTLISEGSGGISGGQRQCLMIARAIAPRPKILMFDEATSALDNLTQKKVSDSLNGLKCTRIVIAHRLSTIRQCDRILYLENGKVAEDGTYDELIAKNGRFAGLVARQQLDEPKKTVPFSGGIV